MRWVAIVMMSLAAGSAWAEPPSLSLDEVLARARAVMDRKPQSTVCRITVETEVLDRAGKREHEDKREGRATLRGNEQDVVTERAWRDGKPMSADELAAERAQAQKRRGERKDDQLELAPLATKNAGQERFELLHTQTLWGRPALVLRVHADGAPDNQTLANGTLWIDAERFVELKGELTPATLPPHTDWVKIQEQYALAPDGVPLPTFLHIEGAGHFMFMKRQVRSTLRWNDCR
jgi:hypothetical protein